MTVLFNFYTLYLRRDHAIPCFRNMTASCWAKYRRITSTMIASLQPRHHSVTTSSTTTKTSSDSSRASLTQSPTPISAWMIKPTTPARNLVTRNIAMMPIPQQVHFFQNFMRAVNKETAHFNKYSSGQFLYILLII